MIDIDKQTAPGEHTALLERQQHNRWWYLERVAMGLIALGALMMFQPFTIVLFTYSYIVILAGVILFTIVSRMAD
ncbi:MAG TPA: hypothetical protein VGJ87_09855 [Roseiflexaceae bacterium]|jgi:hypothetical protein